MYNVPCNNVAFDQKAMQEIIMFVFGSWLYLTWLRYEIDKADSIDQQILSSLWKDDLKNFTIPLHILSYPVGLILQDLCHYSNVMIKVGLLKNSKMFMMFMTD